MKQKKKIKGENKVLGFQGINLLLKIVLLKNLLHMSAHSDRGMSISRRKKDLLQIIWSYIVCEEQTEIYLFKWEKPDYYTVNNLPLKSNFYLI